MRNAAGARTIADLIAGARRPSAPGRARELALLDRLLAPGGALVAYVHGPAGIGKSTLLAAFEQALAERGVPCLKVEGGGVEPTPEALSACFAGRGPGGVVMIDDVDRLRLAWTWLRRGFVPALPADARVVLAGRLPPEPGWDADLGRFFLPLPLRPLDRGTVLSEARDAGLDGPAAGRVWAVSGGHPMVLRLAIESARAGMLDDGAAPAALADAMLATADPGLRRLVEAAAIVRRATRPLLAAMLDDARLDAFEALAALPFVERDREGHHLVEPVRCAIAERLAAEEPGRHAALRTAAAGWLAARLAAAGAAERWRHMADLLHLVEHPQVRDAFFPPDAPAPPVEPAEAADFPAILAIAEAQEGAAERDAVEAWTRALPHRFSVARAADGGVLAFHCHAHADEEGLDRLAAADPLLAGWRAHLARHPVVGAALFLRQLLAREPGVDRPERAACILDIKRAYIARWDLARIYTAASAESLAAPVMRRLGFRPHDGLPGTMIMDLPGAGLVGWISALVGVVPVAPLPFAFARDRREVTVGGVATRLTKREADVLVMLIDRAPAVVTREALIDEVWRRTFVGSNVVDAVVRTLRRKLGPESGRIETVPKAGYRFVGG
jgi:hypothetical protein